MTTAQNKVVEQIKAAIPRFDFYGDEYEVKEWKVEQDARGNIYLVFSTGIKQDEGTLAEILCRKYRLARIGKRGGIYNLHEGKGKGRRGNVSLFDFMNWCDYR